jgi:predicted transcriptional regulator
MMKGVWLSRGQTGARSLANSTVTLVPAAVRRGRDKITLSVQGRIIRLRLETNTLNASEQRLHALRRQSLQTPHNRKKPMSEDQTINRAEILALTTEIVSSHVSNNSTGQENLAELIQSVFDKLTALASDEPAPTELTPAVPIKKSVTDDYIVCLEDGKKLKMLKRHLMTAYGMTPEEYRARWGLKADYPMVAPNYAKKRQELAKKIGLGRKPRAVEPEPAPKARRSRAKAAA